MLRVKGMLRHQMLVSRANAEGRSAGTDRPSPKRFPRSASRAGKEL